MPGPITRVGITMALVAGITMTIACVSNDPGASAPPSCSLYCTEIAKSCGGDKLQYRNTDECMKACSFIDLGTAKDGDVNSIGCRLRKAQSAATIADCVAAGPFGGGVCGTRCGSFCAMVGGTCLTTSAPPFGGSEATCNERCPNFKFDEAEGEGPNQAAFAGKDTINCRSHHLILALKDANGHCPHADVTSVNCK